MPKKPHAPRPEKRFKERIAALEKKAAAIVEGVDLYDPKEELSPREAGFAEAYVRLGVGQYAAVEAGYAEKSAWVTAWRLLQRPRVLRAIARIRVERQRKNELKEQFVLDVLMQEALEGDSSSARVRAAELMGKKLGMFVDKIEVTEKLTPEERLRRLAALGAEAKKRADAAQQEPKEAETP